MHVFYDNLKATDLVYFVTDENIKRLRSPSFSSVLKELQNWSPPPGYAFGHMHIKYAKERNNIG
jgi:hypothetical protein